MNSTFCILRAFVQLPTGLGAGGAARQARVSVRWTQARVSVRWTLPIAVPLDVTGVRFFSRRRAA